MYSENLLSKQYSVFKGLLENVNFADKPSEYAESMENLDVDKYYGQLTLRDGSQKKYSDTFTNILSIYEYKYPTTGETILIINDNGTLEWYKDGVKQTNLTLPAGATLEANFKNNFFGNNDYILITTGNGETNYMLFYGYTQRLSADNDGLFNNQLNDSGTYRLLKNQIIPEYSFLHNIHNIVRLGDYYYYTNGNRCLREVYGEDENRTSHLASKFINVCDDKFNHTDRRQADRTQDNDYVALSVDSVNSLLLVATGRSIYRLNPTTWEMTYPATPGNTNSFLGIDNDGTNVFVVETAHIYKRNMTMAVVSDTTDTVAECFCIAVEITGDYFYTPYTTGTEHYIQQRNKSDLAVNASLLLYDASREICYFYLDEANDLLYVMRDKTQSGTNVYVVNTDTMVLDSTATEADNIFLMDSTIKKHDKGFIKDLIDADMDYPDIITMTTYVSQHDEERRAGGTTGPGTYFFKLSLIDINGQEFSLSDEIIVNITEDYGNIYVYLFVNAGFATGGQAYRIKYFNLYRAYSTLVDAIIPSTNYRFIKQIDINDKDWQTLVDNYYKFSIDVSLNEESLTTVSYQENSGISENTKNKYVNPKYLLWLDSQLHVANFYYDGDTYLNYVIRTPLNSPSNIAFYDYYKFGSAGYEIKGMIDAYGRSILFKDYRYGIFLNGILEYEEKIGISSEYAYAKNGDNVYIANEFGVYHIIGHDKDRISESIKISWAGLTDYGNICMFIMPDKDRLIISIPEEKVFVYNYRYKTWVLYDENAAFKQYFINNSGEYVAYKDDILGAAYEYIYKINLGKDGRTAAGTGGQQIPFSYSSALLKLTDRIGENVTLLELNRRSHWLTVGGEDVTLKVFSYNPTATGFNTLFEKEIIAPIDTYQANQTEYFDGAFGESFSWNLQGYATELKWNAIEFVFERIGRIYA